MHKSAAFVALVLLALPTSVAVEPDVAYEGRTYAFLAPALGRAVGEAVATSGTEFQHRASVGAYGGAFAQVAAGQADFEGYGPTSLARFATSVVRLTVAGVVLEARGVQAEALASCEGGASRSRVEDLRVGNYVVHPTAGQRVALPGGLVAVFDESSGSRSAGVAEQASNALRIVDARGATLAILGHAEARAYGCARVDEGACAGFVPMNVAEARYGDARAGGPAEAAVMPAGGDAVAADFAWMNGVWTHVRLDYDAMRGIVTMTLRGTTAVAARVTGFAPDAVLLVAEASGAKLEVEELRVQDLALPQRLVAQDGATIVSLRGPVLADGYSLDADVRLTWDAAAPPAPDALRLRLLTGRCG